MFTDIVFPDGNEREFVRIGEKLGLKALIFLYHSSKLNEGIRRIRELGKRAGMKLIPGVTAAKIKNIDAHLLFLKTGDNPRPLFENKAVDVIYGLESISKHDSLHQRNSGINHIIAALASKNKIAIAFSFSELHDAKRDTLIGRIAQNIRICRKYKVDMVVGSFAIDPMQMRAPPDVKSLFEVIGMNPGEAKKALSCAYDKHIEKQKQHRVIKEGIEIV